MTLNWILRIIYFIELQYCKYHDHFFTCCCLRDLKQIMCACLKERWGDNAVAYTPQRCTQHANRWIFYRRHQYYFICNWFDLKNMNYYGKSACCVYNVYIWACVCFWFLMKTIIDKIYVLEFSWPALSHRAVWFRFTIVRWE